MSGREREAMERWPDDRLLHAAHRGNKKAFEIFCVRSLPGLIRYLESQCYAKGIPKDRAWDFAQETLTKALAQVSLYRDHGCRPFPQVSAAWLNQIGYNLIIDSLRARRRETEARKALGQRKPRAPSKEQVERYDEVYKFHQWLPAAEKEIVELVLVENKDLMEAAEYLEITSAAAYKRYERAIKHLQMLIREHGSPNVRDLAGDCDDEDEEE
jgi:RNA polymerase sigma factor (sigma-70 family)